MSATTAPPKRTRGKKTEAKKSFWQLELGKKSKDDGDVVEHPPFQPTLPRVDLLPPSIRDSIALRKVWRAVVIALVLLAGTAGALWYLQGAKIDEANAALARAEGEAKVMQAKMAALDPIKEMFTQIESQKTLVNTTMASQPQAAEVFTHLVDAAKAVGGAKPIQFGKVSIQYQGIPSAGDTLNACPNPDPFGTQITMGCLSFDATAGSRDQVSELLLKLEADPMFLLPFVDSSTITADPTGGEGTVTFAGTSGVSLDALTLPLDPKAIDAIVNPPKPATDDSAEGDGAK